MLELEQIPKIVVCDDNPEIHKEIEALLYGIYSLSSMWRIYF